MRTGIKTNRELSSLRPVLKSWRTLNRRIGASWAKDRDAPWWYNERALISVFAGAVWRAGGFCFEEYADQKREIKKRSRRHGKPYRGRVDLYFEWANSRFIVEAKSKWSGFIRNNANAKDTLERCLTTAMQEIRQTPPFGQRRLAIVFAVPYCREKYKSLVNKKLDAWVKMLGTLDTSCYASVFPRCACFKTGDGRRLCCPGIAVLIKEIRR
jgi:hypothetical protein